MDFGSRPILKMLLKRTDMFPVFVKNSGCIKWTLGKRRRDWKLHMFMSRVLPLFRVSFGSEGVYFANREDIFAIFGDSHNIGRGIGT